MLKVKKGDLDAFDRLITRHRNPVVNTLGRLTGISDGAEDLAQEVFLRVYRGRKSYRVKARFTTWLYRIVRNVAANAMRERCRRNVLFVFPGGTGTGLADVLPAERGQGPEERAGAADLKNAVEKALALLTFEQRTAIVLFRLEGMTCAETAKILGKSEGAVKMLVSRAKKILAEELREYLEEG
jgi:RNA polymerase sigma-70 factor (ECF subfamily)